MLVSQDASGGATLVVEKTSMTDAGTYTAVGTNDVGQAETSCEVKVRIMGFDISRQGPQFPLFLPLKVTQAMEEPKFTSLLRSAKAVEGSPIKLEGKVSGHPAPSE